MRISGVESEGGIAKMVAHPLAARKEMSPKVNRLPKAITIAREFIRCRSKIIWLTFVLFLGISVVDNKPENTN
jgi:hypothetical protein